MAGEAWIAQSASADSSRTRMYGEIKRSQLPTAHSTMTKKLYKTDGYFASWTVTFVSCFAFTTTSCTFLPSVSCQISSL